MTYADHLRQIAKRLGMEETASDPLIIAAGRKFMGLHFKTEMTAPEMVEEIASAMGITVTSAAGAARRGGAFLGLALPRRRLS
jgi:hypothetical protein